MVYLDNRLIGLAPVSIPGGTPAPAQLRVEAPGYAPWGDMATVPERGITRYQAVLAPLPGPLTIDVEPPGATVTLDGQTIGAAPLTIDHAAPGPHRVEVNLDDYEGWTGNLLVPPGGGTTEHIALRPMPAQVRVLAALEDTRVWIDDEPMGSPPLTLELDPGEHRFRAWVKGRKPWEQTVALKPNQTIDLDLSLQTSWTGANGEPLFTTAVMIENQLLARPQAGLDRADVVYEALAEGGITRFLAIFGSQSAQVVGPVRSARHYFVYWAAEYQAPLVFVGASPAGYEAMADTHTPMIDEIKGARGFWRTRDRAAPHNLYASTEAVRSGMGAPPEPGSYGGLQFKPDPIRQQGPRAEHVFIRYGFWDYVVEWTYVAETNTYARWMDGQPHKDAVSHQQIEAANVLVQWVDSWPIPNDREKRLDFTQRGSGRLVALIDGALVEGQWSKPTVDSPTTYVDQAGNPILLNAGPTWIQIIPLDAAFHL